MSACPVPEIAPSLGCLSQRDVSCPRCGGALEVDQVGRVVAFRSQAMTCWCQDCGHWFVLHLALLDATEPRGRHQARRFICPDCQRPLSSARHLHDHRNSQHPTRSETA